MAKKFAHLTAQMKTEKRISRQLEVTTTLNPSVTASVTTSSSTSSPRISSLQRSSSSGSSRQSPQRQTSFHSNSCRHRSDRIGIDRTSSSPGTSSSHQHPHSRHHFHQQHSSSQETDLGNDSSSSNSNQVIYCVSLFFFFKGVIHKPRGQLMGEGVSQMTILLHKLNSGR